MNQFKTNFDYELRVNNPDLGIDEVVFSHKRDLIDRNIAHYITINKNFTFKKHTLGIGTGILFSNISTPSLAVTYNDTKLLNVFVDNSSNWEFGIPVEMRYQYSINSKISLGLKYNFRYLASIKSADLFYLSPYIHINIPKRK